MWLILIIILLSLLIFFYQKIRSKQSFWTDKGVKYAEPTFLVGNMKLFGSKSFGELFIDLYNKFPEERYMGVYQFLTPTLMIRDPELIKEITIKDFNSFMDHQTFVPPEIDPVWNRNLFSAKGENWRRLRTVLSPSFSSGKMKIMFGLIDECSRNLVNYFINLDENLIELEMKELFTRYSNDVIATCAFGLKCDSFKNKDNEFYLMGKEASDFKGIKGLKFFIHTISPYLAKIFKIRIFSTKVEKYFVDIIQDTVRTREEKGIVRPDMIHLLMEAMKNNDESSKDKQITVDDIVSQALIFFLAGFDTTSYFLTFLFYELAINPEIQTRLRDELNSVEGEINYETLNSFKYLDMVISESLRKWPIATFIDRIVTKDYTIKARNPNEVDINLKVGSLIWLAALGIQRDPKYYPEPDKFDPERFNDANKQQRDPGTYFPFGIGPRSCIGSRFGLLEGKLVTYHLLKSFEIVPVGRTHVPIVLDPGQINIAAKGGMWLGFKKLT